MAVAESDVAERDPALAGNEVGQMLCVYEKVEQGRNKVVARTIQIR